MGLLSALGKSGVRALRSGEMFGARSAGTTLGERPELGALLATAVAKFRAPELSPDNFTLDEIALLRATARQWARPTELDALSWLEHSVGKK